MDTYSIYDFYNFVQNISIVFSVSFAVILFFCVLDFFWCLWLQNRQEGIDFLYCYRNFIYQLFML